MTIKGKEVDFRISNLKCAASMKLALVELEKTEKEIQEIKDKDILVVLDAMIHMFRQFFITATGTDILSDCEDLMEAREAYEKFLDEINSQKKSMLAPYSPDRIR